MIDCWNTWQAPDDTGGLNYHQSPWTGVTGSNMMKTSHVAAQHPLQQHRIDRAAAAATASFLPQPGIDWHVPRPGQLFPAAATMTTPFTGSADVVSAVGGCRRSFPAFSWTNTRPTDAVNLYRHVQPPPPPLSSSSPTPAMAQTMSSYWPVNSAFNGGCYSGGGGVCSQQDLNSAALWCSNNLRLTKCAGASHNRINY